MNLINPAFSGISDPYASRRSRKVVEGARSALELGQNCPDSRTDPGSSLFGNTRYAIIDKKKIQSLKEEENI